MQERILQLLGKKPQNPAELAQALGISRQALHRHLRTLVQERRIEKQGAGSHVLYVLPSQVSTRVWEDFECCRDELLPQYKKNFAEFFERFVRIFPIENEKRSKGQEMDLGFLLDASSVYSSNIEGNTLDLNSFLNSRMAPLQHRPKEAKEIEDLVSAYDIARTQNLTESQMLRAHRMLSRQFVAPSRRGTYRQEPVGVFSQAGLEYLAVEPHLVKQEMHVLFEIIAMLLAEKVTPAERFFWATWVHLMIALIHPFSDGNGRTARLCEKWFLVRVLGERAFTVRSEEAYWRKRPQYYHALKLGVNYWEINLGEAMSFFRLLPEEMREEQK